jgi:phosphohistidine phosphatase
MPEVPDAAPPLVVLVRHAHAQWPLYSGRDFDRPLTPRGEEDARVAAQAIRAADLVPTLILSSPARRTRQTADILARVLGLQGGQLLFVDALYNARPATLEAELRRVARRGTASVLVAHNPGISDLARQMSGDPQRPDFSPGGWACLVLPDNGG